MNTDSFRRTVVVTGGSGAIGSVVVDRFLAVGCQVIVADKQRPPYLRDSRFDGQGREVQFHQTDLLDEASVKAMIAAVEARYEGIHVLVNVAGGFRFGPSVEQMEETDWDDMLQLNLKSVFLAIKSVLPVMKTNGYGRIISVAARSGLKGDPMVAHYSVSKGGVILLTQSVAEEVKTQDITVNAVLPSIVDTPANRRSMPDSDPSGWVYPDDLASVILFLASDDARAVSGAAIPVYYKA